MSLSLLEFDFPIFEGSDMTMQSFVFHVHAD